MSEILLSSLFLGSGPHSGALNDTYMGTGASSGQVQMTGTICLVDRHSKHLLSVTHPAFTSHSVVN
jgi:hypothetical protein